MANTISTKNKHIINISIITLIAILITGALFLLSYFNLFTPASRLLLQQALLFLLTVVLSIYCFLISREVKAAWRYFFILLGMSSVTRVALIAWPIINVVSSSHNNSRYSAETILNVIHMISLVFDIIAWSLFASQVLIKSKHHLRKLTPFLPTLLTLLLVYIFIATNTHKYIVIQKISPWDIIKAYYDLIIFLLIIFCIPMIRNINMAILTVAFLLFIVADIFKYNATFAMPYLTQSVPPYFIMLLAKMLFIYSIYMLTTKKQVQKWISSADSTRTQVDYWGNSIATFLFLLIGLHTVLTKDTFAFDSAMFSYNIRVLIPFITLLSLLTLVFAQLFSSDFKKIKKLMRNRSDTKDQEKQLISSMNFEEFRKFSVFLTSRINILKQKKEKQKKIFEMAGHAAHDIRTPISILSIFANTAEQHLSNKELRIYKNALEKVKSIACDLLTLQKKSGGIQEAMQTDQAACKFVAILFFEFMQQKAVQYEHLQIDFKYSITAAAWFSIITIEAHDFFRALSDQIKQVIATLDKATSKKITCHLNWQWQQTKLTIDINKATKLCFPITNPTPRWWIQQLKLPNNGHVIIFDDDSLCHQQWDSLLTPYQKAITLEHCYDEKDFLDSIKKTNHKLILIDYDIQGSEKLGLDYIKGLHLQDCAILVTNHYHHPEVQHQCEQEGVFLLPKPLLPHITIKLEP